MTAEEEARKNILEVCGLDNPNQNLINFFIVVERVRMDTLKRIMAEQQAAG